MSYNLSLFNSLGYLPPDIIRCIYSMLPPNVDDVRYDLKQLGFKDMTSLDKISQLLSSFLSSHKEYFNIQALNSMERAAIHKYRSKRKYYTVVEAIQLGGDSLCQTCHGSGVQRGACSCCSNLKCIHCYGSGTCHGSRLKTIKLKKKINFQGRVMHHSYSYELLVR